MDYKRAGLIDCSGILIKSAQWDIFNFILYRNTLFYPSLKCTLGIFDREKDSV